MSFFKELKRRNVIRMGIAYLAGAWLLIQMGETLFPVYGLSDAAIRLVITLLAIGFPITLIFSWVYELTPEGLKLERDVNRSITITHHTGKKLDRAIIVLLTLMLGYFAFDKFVLEPGRDVEIAATAAQIGAEQAMEEARLGKFNRRSIAVLPFVNRSHLVEDEYFTDGMHDELLTRLARIAALKVTSRTSVRRYRNTEKTIPEIAEELAVATILEGGVQRVGKQVRINVQLINAHTDEHLWAEIYDRELTTGNLFAIQSDITKAITRSLKATLTSEEEQVLEQIPTENLAAYDAYIIGRTMLDSLAKEDMDDAVEKFTLATQLDTNFAAAWAGLCEAQLMRYKQNSDQRYFDAGETACNRAMELGDSSVEVHIALGALYRISGRYSRAEVSIQRAKLAKAEQALENALSIDGLSLDALIEFGFILAVQNRLEEAETKLLRAEELDPNYWSAQSALFGFYYSYSDKPDRYKLAARHAVRATSLRPDMAASWNNLGTANYMLMQYDQATDAWQQSLSIEPTRTAYTNSGLALENLHRYKEAAGMQEKAAEMAPRDHRSWGRLAAVLMRVEGGNDRALEAYDRATILAREKLEINDRDWRTLGNLASYLAATGKNKEAMEAAQRAMQLSERRPEALFRATLVYCKDGYSDACFSLLEEMVDKDASYRQFIDITDPALKDLNPEESKRFQAIITAP